MKKFKIVSILIVVQIVVNHIAYAQNVGVGNTNPLEKLHVSGKIRSDSLAGVGSRVVFADPNGTLFDTILAPSSDDWKILGNAGTNAAVNFLGTTDNIDMVFRTNNTEVGRFKTNGAFGLGVVNPDASSLLEMSSTTRGLLIPRLTTAQRTAIAAPADGLLVYDVTIACFFFYSTTSTAWQSLCAPPLPPGANDISGTYPNITVVGIQTTPVDPTAPNQGDIFEFDGTNWKPTPGGFWKLTGNAGTVAGANFIGTTDAVDWVIKTNNVERARILSGGNVGIGTATPAQLLTIEGGHIQLGETMAATASGRYLFFSDNSNNTDVLGFFRENKASDVSDLIVHIGDNYATGAGTDRFSVVAQTSPSPVFNHILTATSMGRVGINQYNPVEALEINGSAMINTGAADGGRMIWRGGTGATQEYRARMHSSGYLGFFPSEFGNPGYIGDVLVMHQNGNIRMGIPNGLSPTITPASADNPLHKVTVGYGYFLAGNYNSDPNGGSGPGTTWIGGVGGLAIGMNRNAGHSHADFWNTTAPGQAAATSNTTDRGFEWRGYDNTNAERVMMRLTGDGNAYSNNWLALSDQRFKTNIIENKETVMDRLMKVKTYTYNKIQPVYDDKGVLKKGGVMTERELGVLVQEIYELFPMLAYKPVDENKETWAMDYSKLSLYLLQGMKEQQQVIEKQQIELDKINKNYEELLKRIQSLEQKQ